MKRQILTLSATILLIVASCSKSTTEVPSEEIPVFKRCKQTEVKFADGTVFQYEYDDRERVVKWKQIWKNSPLETITYLYSNDQIIETEVVGQQTTVTRHMYDSSGRIGTSKTDGTNYTVAYTYDASGYLTRRSVNNAQELTQFLYTDGNLTTVRYDNGTYTISYGGTENAYSGGFFRYNTNDAFPEQIETPLYEYYGTRSRILPTKSVVTRSGTETTETYTYEKDKNGNVTKFVNSVKVGANTSYTNTMQYTYNCNK